MSDTTRLEALEIKTAHLEHAVQQLSDALYRQQIELERVISRNAQLLAELDAAAPSDAATRYEKPPHY